MNQSHNRTIRYAIAGLGVLVLLILIEWLVLREPPTSTNEQSAQAVSTSPRDRPITPLFMPADDVLHESPASQIIETPETNAAVIYRQAFALYDALSKDQKEIVSNWRTNVDASVEAELCEKIQPICDLMHRAAALTNCDWGLEQPITFETRLPHLSPCRSIARATVWSAAHCRRSNLAGAVDDIVAGSRLGRNLSPGLIDHLVDVAIQNLVIDVVTERAGILVGAGDTRLAQLFDDADYDEGLNRGIEQDADMLSRLADQLTAMPREELIRNLKQMFEDNSEWQSTDPAQAIAYIRQYVELEREYAKMLGTSDVEYREWLARLESVRKTNPIAEAFLPGIESSVAKTDAMTIRSAMVAAGLAVIRDGTDSLKSYTDPATGQPFVYTPTADGFELQSGYQFLDKPVKLSFK